MDRKPSYAALLKRVEELEQAESERRQAREALSESKRKYSTILDGIEESYLEVNLSGDLQFFNTALCTLLGYAKDELIGKNFGTFVDKANADKIFKIFQTVYQTGESAVGAGWEFIRKDGTRRFIEASVSLITDSAGKGKGFRGFGRDTTEQRLAENSLRQSIKRTHTILQTIQSGLLIIDAKTHVIIDTNRAAEDMIGAGKEEIIGKRCHHFVCLAEQGNCPVTDKGEVLNCTETILLRKDGSEIDILKTISSIHLDDRECLVESFVDISESKRAAADALAHQERFKVFFSSVNDAIFVHPFLEGGFAPFIEVNDIACKRYGYSRDEFLTLTVLDITKKTDAKVHATSNHRKKLLYSRHQFLETVHIKKNGEAFPVEINANIIKQYGRPVILAVVRDISERKNVERALKKEKETLSTILNSTPHGIALIDKNDNYLYLNPYFTKITGYTLTDIPTRQVWFKKVYSDEDYRNRVVEVWNQDKSGLSVKGHREFKIKCKNGQSKYIEFRRTFLEDEMICVLTDVTQRKKAEKLLLKSEKRYRTLFEKAVDAIFVVDRKSGKYIDANNAALTLTGRSWEELRHLKTKDVTPEGSADRLKSIHESDDMLRLGEVIYVRPNGERRTAKLSSFPLDEDTSMGIARDLTRELGIEKKLRQAQKMEAIGTLAGGIAHDFNNILSGVFGYSQLAQMDIEDPEKVEEYLHRIIESGERASKLIQQILTFSRQAENEKQYLNLHLIAKEALKLLRSTIPTTIEIRENIHSNATVFADPTQMHQVIMNLCTNAYHAMNDTGGILTVNLKEINISGFQDRPALNIPLGKYIELEIGDTGHGMDETILEKVFEPYFTTKERGKGTGLGLSLVHAIVEDHQGHIKVQSAIEKGTHFYLYFPIKTKADEHDIKITKNLNLKGTGNILLVDDEKDILFTTSQILTHNGYDVVCHENPIAAFEAFKKAPGEFDLVITDMTMPKMTGAELATGILKIRHDIPIILCTGYNDSCSKEDAKKIGINRYMHKPVVSQKLLAIIKEELII